MPNGIQTFNLPDIAQRAESVKASRLTNRVNELRLQDAQRKAQREESKRDIFQGAVSPEGEFDPQAAQRGLFQGGFAEEAFDLQKVNTEQQKASADLLEAVAGARGAELENVNTKLNLFGTASLGLTQAYQSQIEQGKTPQQAVQGTQPIYERVLQSLQAQDIDTSNFPQQFDPNTALAMTFASKDALDSLSQAPAKREIIKGATIGEETATLQETTAGSGEFEVLTVGGVPARGKKKAAVQINLGKPASAGERTAIAETRATIDELNNLKTLFDESFVGPLAGKIGAAKNIFGLNAPKREALIAATSAFKNQMIKAITGAQMSEPEAKRIMKQIPSETDAPSVWAAKWTQSVRNLETINNRRKEVLTQSGLRAPETLLPGDVPQGSIEIPNVTGPGGRRVFRTPDGRAFETGEQ